MKKFIFLLAFIGLFVSSQAQVASKVHSLGTIAAGNEIKFNIAKLDTLKSNDTLSYTVRITKFNEVNLSQQISFKLVAADTAVTIKYYQSYDGIVWVTMKDSSESAYTNAIAKTSALTVDYHGINDQCIFDAKYLKVMFVGKTKAGFKTIPYGYISTLLK